MFLSQIQTHLVTNSLDSANVFLNTQVQLVIWGLWHFVLCQKKKIILSRVGHVPSKVWSLIFLFCSKLINLNLDVCLYVCLLLYVTTFWFPVHRRLYYFLLNGRMRMMHHYIFSWVCVIHVSLFHLCLFIIAFYINAIYNFLLQCIFALRHV